MQMRQYQQQQQQCMQERHVQPSQQINQQNIQLNMQQVESKQQFVRYQGQQEPKKEESAEQPWVDTSVKEAAIDKANLATGVQPRRSRRLSREGQSLPTAEMPQNGVGTLRQRAAAEGQAGTGGVIQSPRRRRRSKEINLETLAQQAAKRESLPAKVKVRAGSMLVQFYKFSLLSLPLQDVPVGRQSSMAPLVMPVSVPVPRPQETEGSSSLDRHRTSDRCGGQSLYKASVIVARRRSLRNSVAESPMQTKRGKPKPKRRPRPEPLIIPPPRPSSFITPSVYSSITPYQSNLRSPVRPLDPPLVLPPYTPPPILSPLRGGSGLYFSTFLSNMAAGTQALPPQATPKSATVSLLRLTSSEESPLTIVTDATPVSLEPRINIGQQYQAEIPDLQSPGRCEQDLHKADLLWCPLEDPTAGGQDLVRDLMNMACSSVLRGGGTNQELALHCLFQSGGDVLETVGRLMLQDVLFPKDHPLCNYHYSGSDSWTPEEKRYFNKGISAYRKDFIMVQKLVQTKSVAQCVEFYYTYKKQVKVGRSGNVTFGPLDSPLDQLDEMLENKVWVLYDVELTHQLQLSSEQNTSSEQMQESRHQARVAQSLQAHDYAVSVVVPDPVNSTLPQPSVPPRPRAEPQAKKGKAPPKAPADPDQVFPCKKCGRVFGKVKSRSAHMKSHAEQEKKAAALRLRQQEEQNRARTLQPGSGSEQGPGSRPGSRTDQGRPRTVGPYQEQGSGTESSEADDVYDEDWH
ncbi:hypothetical protein NQD34_017508 [Periophthalmus magnuspinnatus]|nr:hypothetical protein NQD34_017508 [Periophthalmus magnuspinnatus]